MDLRSEILKEHSKIQAEKIVKWVGNNPERFAELMHLFLTDVYRVVQRAAWPVGIIGERRPALIRPHLAQMVQRMTDAGVHIAVKRNIVRLLQFADIPEELHGPIMNTCFNLLADVNEAIAVRVFSMSVLANLAQTYPEIKPELKAIIEDTLEHEPAAAFIARSKMVLKQLAK